MLLERMMRAARLDINLYEEVEHDLNATSQAATVVGIVALCSGLGNGIGLAMGGQTGFAIVGFIGGILMAFISWVAWSYITYFVGTSRFSSASQFCTTTMFGGVAVWSAPPPSLITRNRWPSGAMSYERPERLPEIVP